MRKLKETTKEKMRAVHLSGKIDYVARERKRKQTLKNNGSVSGRPKGTGKKNGINLPCPICEIGVYHTQGEIKQKKRKHCSISCLMQNKEYREKLRKADKSYMQSEKYKNTLRKENVPEYKRFQRQVIRETEKTYANYIELINPQRHPRTLCGVSGGWQLDHIKSIRSCFDDGMSIQEASRKENLQMLPWLDNLLKGK
jgi:hypothetical protein